MYYVDSKNRNKQNRSRFINTENKLAVARWQEDEGLENRSEWD